MTPNAPHIVVIGGGYAGVLAANHLQQAAHAKITLVNPRPEFVERIRLHQLAVGNHSATTGYDTVLGDRVRLLVDSVERIDAPIRQVQLASGDVVDYDYLLYAVGSTGGVPTSVPGAAEFAYPLSELEQAQRLCERLQDIPMSAPVVVVGGGLTGIEAAGEFAEAGRPVTLITDVVGASLGDQARRSVVKALRKLGVTIVSGPDILVASVGATDVTLADGTRLPSAVTVWTTGFGVPGLAAASGLTTDELGRLITDETLTSVDDDRIVAAGDCASPSGIPLRMSCQAAGPMGIQAANTVLARLAGTEPAVLNQAFTGQCVSVGRTYGTVQIAHSDDTPRRLYFGGRTGAAIKEQVCKATITFMAKEGRKPGSYFWFKGRNRARQLAEAAKDTVGAARR
ncbi:NAD(P)/FAD-dependent oxidoreductase [Mycolicibacterium smegmatis]|uniref:FAD-dependent pyridine nucleotide-disulfide oxidoreductase n=4 Tax=Mycolicibacterium smegmatis TaxID=1772 RepID=I7FK86_MYCS2|nr:FAD-dependent oxidoreductase [Mycolicibacterium smegmatis]ABK75613.1 dehydrogenase [Mycolicibacterium smegmatis MC2 155]AFP41735.1 FAD-dependent pyridine nucleotide-disulfide oxidoreductase [Mycolicibacterium smegmatis MC2 155]AIU10462.1 pyridine nucleotide-disulfide oxidoreductase [Mycolicibacterium smegmatis MC2 155]AIU17087.1 pyridine nucleotide-disulfide oxidoreductase [Mycolicibacterium smegmatis]AIU23710.1 pyridine nucleotide-disulfide oxidoreductase [Mycolicibacterium smegmatis]